MQRSIALILGPLLFVLVTYLNPFEGLSEQGHAVWELPYGLPYGGL